MWSINACSKRTLRTRSAASNARSSILPTLLRTKATERTSRRRIVDALRRSNRHCSNLSSSTFENVPRHRRPATATLKKCTRSPPSAGSNGAPSPPALTRLIRQLNSSIESNRLELATRAYASIHELAKSRSSQQGGTEPADCQSTTHEHVAHVAQPAQRAGLQRADARFTEIQILHVGEMPESAGFDPSYADVAEPDVLGLTKAGERILSQQFQTTVTDGQLIRTFGHVSERVRLDGQRTDVGDADLVTHSQTGECIRSDHQFSTTVDEYLADVFNTSERVQRGVVGRRVGTRAHDHRVGTDTISWTTCRRDHIRRKACLKQDHQQHQQQHPLIKIHRPQTSISNHYIE
ncbi:hypothetical protein T4D_2054 [Trichinella pseudospiralis]|uniref:Uncharacterized protein n=1 Tax=Trichinella pseudospiralis TaxID=6337 RepID=A0A0V1FR83_TRIPS|nr:hypothetical protein T4D_2054 [Trichinella pseudospiralis]